MTTPEDLAWMARFGPDHNKALNALVVRLRAAEQEAKEWQRKYLLLRHDHAELGCTDCQRMLAGVDKTASPKNWMWLCENCSPTITHGAATSGGKCEKCGREASLGFVPGNLLGVDKPA